MKRLPDDLGFDEFTTVPVEGFGAALLAGYGWIEGRGVGRNAKKDVKIVQYERRTAKEGLGFKPEMHDRKQEGLLDGREEVTSKVNEVAELGSVEEKKCLKNLVELKIQESRDDKSSRDERRATSGSHGYDREKRDGSNDYRRKDKRQREEGRRGGEMKIDNGATS
ncbi:PREDICTED: protein MOS2-like [Nelumbo nucifera]|uniref:Protein MOS2-like n=1 Tax=Nelumbo nucifera TaxID=4432 RepID=A0A1U8Q334_NELNU|nr:PREDICTED: protein MOS2-like [Nelumbo nucifera]